MLTESREAMSFQIIANTCTNTAMASLSSPQFGANPFLSARARYPKFMNFCGTLSHELRKAKGHQQSMFPVPLFDLILVRARGNLCRNFKSGGTGGNVSDLAVLSDFTGMTYRWYQRRDYGILPAIRIEPFR
jgi:hypothetical protein